MGKKTTEYQDIYRYFFKCSVNTNCMLINSKKIKERTTQLLTGSILWRKKEIKFQQ